MKFFRRDWVECFAAVMLSATAAFSFLNQRVREDLIDKLHHEIDRLRAQIREGNERFDATVEAVVEERLKRCQGCGEVSARTLLCRSCTLVELEDHPNTVALRDLPF